MNFSKNPPAALEHCVGAGEPLNGEAIKIWERMSGLQIHDGYGQTETILVCGNFEGTPIRPGSMGKPAPGIHMALLDESGKQVPPGTEGNIAILVEGSAEPNQGFFGIFDGYITENGRIQRTMCYSVEKDGIAVKRSWFLTGDRAKRDVAGYFWFVGRADDIINSSGYRIGRVNILFLLLSGTLRAQLIHCKRTVRG
jgi:acyl-coenzyme A synthetase/AMP-(fatty) acid ligase